MKNPNSKIFDEAFFVVKENAFFDKKEKNPLDAAKKIIRDIEEENSYRKKRGISEAGKAILFTLIGVAIGVLISLT